MTGTRKRISLCAGAMVMGRHFNLAQDEERVGVLLPPGPAGAATLLALALGRVAPQPHRWRCHAGAYGGTRRLKTIISARAYHSRIGEPALPAAW